MLYRIGNQKLVIPGIDKKKGMLGQCVQWRDVAESCRNIDAICSTIMHARGMKIVDAIARSGFWGAVFRNRWADCRLTLNNQSAECTHILLENFPDAQVLNKDIRKWAPKRCDIAILDFDHFTLRKIEEWENVLKVWSKACKYLIVADGACFGFKFGNLRHYGCGTEEEYYHLLSKSLKKLLDKRVTVVSKFANAAMVLFENTKGKHIKFLPPSDMLLSRGGTPYGQKHKKKTTAPKGLFG